MAEVAQLTVEVKQKGVQKATSDIKGLGDTAARTEKRVQGMQTQASKSSGSVGNFGRTAGMAGIQIEQMAGQMALGVNPMRALGVQAADLGFILGVPLLGAVIGIGAAIGSVLMPQTSRAKTSIEELQEVTDLLDKTFKRTSSSTQTLSDDILEIAQRSEAMALLKLAQSARQVEVAIEAASDAVGSELADTLGSAATVSKNFNSNMDRLGISAQELANNVIDTTSAVDNFGAGGANAINDLRDTISSLTRIFGLTREQAIEFAVAVSDFKTDDSVNNIDALAQVSSTLGAQLKGDSADAFQTFASNLIDISSKAISAEDKLKLINKAQADLTGFIKDNSRVMGDNITAIDTLVQALDDEEKALTRAKNETISLAAAKVYLQAVDAGMTADQALALQNRYLNIQAMRDELRQTNQNTNANKTSLQTLLALGDKRLSQDQQIRNSYARRIAELQSQRDTDLANEQAYNDAILGLEMERDGKLQDLSDRRIRRAQAEAQANMDSLDLYMQQVQFNMENVDVALRDITAGALQTFQYSVGDAFEQFATGQINAEEALQNVSRAILGGVINALGQMVAQYIVSQLAIDSFARTAAVAAATGTAFQSQAMVMQAGLNAYASTAAIPVVGPALAPAAMATAIATTQPLATAAGTLAMTGAVIGGRALGGQVRPGETYVVGERGPEVLTMGNSMAQITTNEALRGGKQTPVSNNVANVSFNINANDTKGFDKLLNARRGQIVGMINQALNESGKVRLV